MRHFLVADMVRDPETTHTWPWLNVVPPPLRHAAARLARPRLSPVASAEDGAIAGYSLALSSHWPAGRVAKAVGQIAADLSPVAYGWTAGASPPSLPGVEWRSGRILALLAVLSLFQPDQGPFSHLGLQVLLIGNNQPELATAARFLARPVRRLIVACPVEHFRNRLALQILAESGLAILTRPDPTPAGWDVAIDLRYLPPSVLLGARVLRVRPCFSRPPRWSGRAPTLADAHPAWPECYLACLAPSGQPLLPYEVSLSSLQIAMALAGQVGLGFALA